MIFVFKKQKTSFRNAGFTLAEILVVISIMALLSSIVLVAVKGARKKAKEKAVLQYAASVHHSLGAYTMGEWTFDVVDGTTVKDTSGNDKDGYRTSGAKITSDGVVGDALDLSDNDGYLNVPGFTVDNQKALTIAQWFNITSDGSWISISKAYAFGKPYFFIWRQLSINNITFFLGTYPPPAPSDSLACSSFLPTLNEWHFLVATWNGSQMKMFYDGKELCSKDSVASLLDGENTNSLRVGAYGSSYLVPGYIDEVRVYNKGLSLAQIQKLYAEGAEKRGLLAEE